MPPTLLFLSTGLSRLAIGRLAEVGTWGPGAFDNDDALDLIDWLAGADGAARVKALEWIFGQGALRPDDLGESRRSATVLAAAAVCAAGVEEGEDVRAQIIALGYDPASILVPDSSPALADAALTALLLATGPDGEWQQGWADAGTGLSARRSASQLASVFYRNQHRHDQELPLEY